MSLCLSGKGSSLESSGSSDFRGKRSIYINGELLKAQDGLGEATIAGAAEYPVELGEDEYFLLGDNRESSEDSRFSGIGNIKRENLIGRVWLRFQPFSRLGFVR